MDKEKSKEKRSIGFWICCFLVYCVIGWIYEVIWEFKVGNGFVNRGFLYGPYLPIYGFGVLTLLLILKINVYIRQYFLIEKVIFGSF